MKHPGITGLPAGLGLRHRARADGTLRLWWEPTVTERAKGAQPADLDPDRLSWSVREAKRLKAQAGRAGKPAKPVVGRTMNALIDDYEASLGWRKLAPKTRETYTGEHRIIRRKWGSDLVADFSKPVLRTWYEACYEQRGPHAALNLGRAMSRLFAHAELRGWRPEGSNPCYRLGMEVPKGRRRNASWAELDALLAAAAARGLPNVGRAVLLSLFAGSRQTDVIHARRECLVSATLPSADGDRRGLVWALRRSKRGNDGLIPIHAEAEAHLAPLLASGPAAGPLFVDERTGQPWTQGLFHDRFAEVRDAAVKAGHPSLADLQFRDLRRTFGAWSRAGGADKADVGDVLGNSAAVNPQLAEVYMAAQLTTVLRAVDAIRRPGKTEKKTA